MIFDSLEAVEEAPDICPDCWREDCSTCEDCGGPGCRCLCPGCWSCHHECGHSICTECGAVDCESWADHFAMCTTYLYGYDQYHGLDNDEYVPTVEVEDVPW